MGRSNFRMCWRRSAIDPRAGGSDPHARQICLRIQIVLCTSAGSLENRHEQQKWLSYGSAHTTWTVPARSPWPPAFAPSTPHSSRVCSPTSSLLRQGLTSPACTSSASVPHLPDADHTHTSHMARPETSRFPDKARIDMPGSRDHAERVGARDSAPTTVAFRRIESVGTRDQDSFAAQWLAYRHLCQRFAAHLTMTNA